MSAAEIRDIAIDHFMKHIDIEKIEIILAWLTVKGYDIDAAHQFDGREFGCWGNIKNLNVSGVNLQGYSNNNEGIITDFNFYTKDGSCYHVDTDRWAMIALSRTVVTDTDNDVVVKLN